VHTPELTCRTRTFLAWHGCNLHQNEQREIRPRNVGGCPHAPVPRAVECWTKAASAMQYRFVAAPRNRTIYSMDAECFMSECSENQLQRRGSSNRYHPRCRAAPAAVWAHVAGCSRHVALEPRRGYAHWGTDTKSDGLTGKSPAAGSDSPSGRQSCFV